MVVALAAVLALGAPVSANATGVDIVASADDQNASMSGVITGVDGSPAGGVGVYLTRVDVYDYWSNRVVDTDHYGSYSFTGLPAGTYTLRFSCIWRYCSAPFEEEWWKDRPDAATADRFTVAPGQQLTGLDAQLSSGSKITGVAVGIDGFPLAEVSIQLYRVDGDIFTPLGSRQTDSTGTFLFDGLEPGTYTLEFAPPWESNHLRTWWGGSADQNEAVTLDVGQDQQLTGLRAQLRPGAVVTGVLTDADGSPLGGHVVELLRASGGGWERPSGMRTRADGVYTFSGLEPGTYSLYYWSGGADEREFIGEYWLDKPESSVADAFEVSQGQVLTGMDAQLSTRPVELPDPSLSTYSPSVGMPVVADVFSPTPGAEFAFQWFTNGTPVDGATSRSFVPSDEHFGQNIRVRVIATAPAYSPVLWESSDWGPVRKTIRLSGDNRYATSVAISASHFQPGVPVAYIASAVNFPDALSGAPLAGLNGGPVLLTAPDALPDVVAEELQRLQPDRIVILGGTAVISRTVEERLDTLTPGSPTRLAGDNRYATSVAISASHFQPGVPVAYIASAVNFPDALSGAPLAGLNGGPVLLTAPDALPDVVAEELQRLQPDRIVILGGTAVISRTVEERLDTLTPGSPTRLAGDNRYATSVAISASHFQPGVPVAYIASAVNFPDALSGAPLAGLNGGPVLLTAPDALPDVVAEELQRLQPDRIVILGGTAVISRTVEEQLDTLE